MTLSGSVIAFFIISLFIIGCAIMMLNFRKVIYMALCIGGVFVGCAAIYMLLGAEFVGVAQLMVYAGAITILIMFAIMLTNHEAMEPPMQWNARNILSALGCTLLGGVILLAIRATKFPPTDGSVDLNGGESNAVAIGTVLFKQYAIPFELVSLLLIVGLVGAVILAKDRKEEE